MTLEAREKEWDESKHPRVPGGSSEGGQFGSGGGGGDSDDEGGGGRGEHPGKGYSKDAYVKNGVIHTPSVYDAQRALHENRRVELDQPRKVSVLLQKLGEVSKKMIDKGGKAPVFNLCNVSVKGTSLFCADTKGIPRVEMPQLDKQQTKDFQKYLKDKGYKVKKEKQFASHLRATQNELNGAKVAAGAEKIQENGGKVKSIIVSKDDYILDGHHAWAAKLGLDAADNNLTNDLKMHVVRVNISITKLLEEADTFTGGKGRKDVDEKNLVNIGEVFRDWDESEHPRDEGGKFAFGGGGDGGGEGYEFVSPNVGALDFDGAVKELGSARQGLLSDASKDINGELEIDATHFDVVGAWKDGAENSVMDVSTGADWERMRLSGAMKGWVADQKSVLIFQQRDQGDGVLAKFEAAGNLTQIHDNLLADGVENHTLVPTATGATVYVADLDNSQAAAVKKAATRYGPENQIEVHFGHGEFIGTDNYEGSDRDQRDRARGVYETHIERSTVPGSKEIWQRVRDRWGKALAESDTAEPTNKALDYLRRFTSDTLYVNRPLLNANELIGWAKNQGFAKTITADDMHVTVAFSRAPVNWDKLTGSEVVLIVAAGSPRHMDRLGKAGEVVVLSFVSDELQKRWQQFREAGASWDWPDFTPHITISFDADDLDVDLIEPYGGELIFGPEIFDELDEDWKSGVVERKVDYIQDPATGHLMGSHPSGGDDKEGGDKESADKGEFYKPSAEAMAVGGDEWNKETAERLEREFVEAAPSLDGIVKEATAVETAVDMASEEDAPNPDDAPVVPEEWDMLSGDQQEEALSDYKKSTLSDWENNEQDYWNSEYAPDEARVKVADDFTDDSEYDWASGVVDKFLSDWKEAGHEVPFEHEQILNALTVEYEAQGGGSTTKSDIAINDAELGLPKGWLEGQQTLPGIDVKPEEMLSEKMREDLLERMDKGFEKEALHVQDKLETPSWVYENITEQQEDSWGQMSDKEKFAWVTANTTMVEDAQKEYDEYFGDSQPGGETGVVVVPKKYDPLEQGASAQNYEQTRVIARHLSVERAAQIMVDRKLYTDIEKARKDAKLLDRNLWDGWKSSSHGDAGQLLQKATAEELGGRLNPNMINLTPSQIEAQAEGRAENAPEGKAYDAVKAYVRGKWETTQFLLRKAGIETVNVYRAVNMTDAAKLHALGPSVSGNYRVSAAKIFDTEQEAKDYMKIQNETHQGYGGAVAQHHETYRVDSNYEFPSKQEAEDFIKKYESDPNNPEHHTEQVSYESEHTAGTFTRLPDIHIDRNGAASTTTDKSVANNWDGGTGRVVLRASVPRTAVISVPAYGINVHGEHEVVVAGTAWKGWDAWYGEAPHFESIKIGHQIVPEKAAA